jgi:ribonuclease HII
MQTKPRTPTLIVGIDEVGRGPVAGPVAVGAFVFLNPPARSLFKGVKESKHLSEAKREYWFERIEMARKNGLVNYCVTFKSEKVIDKRGLSFAIRSALSKSLAALRLNPAAVQVLLDGGLKAPAEYSNQRTIIKGDEKRIAIALASICAKVLRDRRLNKLGKKYPQYGFEKHKGYGTKAHFNKIKEIGPCKIHRKTFYPLLSEIK